MKILQLFNYYQHTSGEDVYFDSLVRLLRSKGHDVYAYTKNSKGIIENVKGKLRVAVGMFQNIKVENELEDIIKKFKPDIAHFHNIYPLITPVAYLLCRKYRIPIVQTIHNYRFLCPRATLLRKGKICELCINNRFKYSSIIHNCYHSSFTASLLYSLSDFYYQQKKAFDSITKYIFLTNFTHDYYLKYLNIPKEKTSIIPYFTDDFHTEEEKKTTGDYILYVGRLVEEKGIIPLLDLFVKLPQAQLVVIGAGPLENMVNKYAKHKNILIKGKMERFQTIEYIRNARFTIFSSLWYDALPLTLIESYSQSTPVIVPKFGVFPDLVDDGKSGIFFQYNNYEDLKEKIINIYNNSQPIKTMSVYSRKEYEKKYTSEHHYISIMKLYRSLVE